MSPASTGVLSGGRFDDRIIVKTAGGRGREEIQNVAMQNVGNDSTHLSEFSHSDRSLPRLPNSVCVSLGMLD